jgi:hypothetical protein
MKTLKQQDIKEISGGAVAEGEPDSNDIFNSHGHCQYLRPTFVPKRNPIFRPPGPTTDPVIPVWVD